MKQLLILTAVMAFAVVPAMHAADAQAADKPACCVASKAECTKAPGQPACIVAGKVGCTKAPCQGTSCATACKGKKECAKTAKQTAKAAKKAAQAEKKAAKKAS